MLIMLNIYVATLHIKTQTQYHKEAVQVTLLKTNYADVVTKLP